MLPVYLPQLLPLSNMFSRTRCDGPIDIVNILLFSQRPRREKQAEVTFQVNDQRMDNKCWLGQQCPNPQAWRSIPTHKVLLMPITCSPFIWASSPFQVSSQSEFGNKSKMPKMSLQDMPWIKTYLGLWSWLLVFCSRSSPYSKWQTPPQHLCVQGAIPRHGGNKVKDAQFWCWCWSSWGFHSTKEKEYSWFIKQQSSV